MDFIGPQMNKTWFVNYGFLNQACAGLWLACAWFLRIAFVRKCLYVYVSAPEAINN